MRGGGERGRVAAAAGLGQGGAHASGPWWAVRVRVKLGFFFFFFYFFSNFKNIFLNNPKIHNNYTKIIYK
jgi:hypothetical protein